MLECWIKKYLLSPFNLVGVILMLIVYSTYSFLCLASDDSYIYLGYVKAINRGALFSYNVGEHSGGTTGILYYYLLLFSYIIITPLFGLLTSLQTHLVATTYLLNSFLWSLVAIFILKIFEDKNKYLGFLVLILLLPIPNIPYLSEATYKYSWGFWSGLEGPLMSLLLTYLIYLVQTSKGLFKDQRYIMTLVGLALTRPNWVPICAVLVLPALFSVRNFSDFKKPLIGLIIFLALYLPLYFFTGELLPSAAGARAKVSIPNFDIDIFMANLGKLHNTLWFGLSIFTIVVGIIGRSKLAIWAALIVFIDFCNRAYFNLTDLNIEDRYISFTFVILLIGIVDSLKSLKDFKINFISEKSLTISICILTGILTFRVLQKDITEMNQVVVYPSMWMSKNIPQNSRVIMEPAGALRVWNDFYLIDYVGLTTQHLKHYGFWTNQILFEKEKPDFTFIYPKLYFDWGRYFQARKCWIVDQRYSVGDICIFDNQRSDALELVNQFIYTEKNPSLANLIELTLTLINVERLNDAEEIALKAIRLFPEESLLYNNLGVIYMKQFRWLDARRVFERAIELNSRFDLAKNNLNYAISQSPHI